MWARLSENTASIKKRKCYVSSLPHPFICVWLPSWTGDIFFSFKAVWNWVQPDPFVLIKSTRGHIQIEYSPPLLMSLFWQDLTSAKELNSAVSVSSRSQSTEGKLSLWPCLKVTVNRRKKKPHAHKTCRKRKVAHRGTFSPLLIQETTVWHVPGHVCFVRLCSFHVFAVKFGMFRGEVLHLCRDLLFTVDLWSSRSATKKKQKVRKQTSSIFDEVSDQLSLIQGSCVYLETS